MVGFGAIIVSMFKPQWAQYTAPTYAICKGVALAGMSAMLELSYPGGRREGASREVQRRGRLAGLQAC
jgi:hypothetical protein